MVDGGMTDPKPSTTDTSMLLDELFDDGRPMTHAQRIERLVQAALTDPSGRLRFEEELARGGMGAVRQAFDASLQRRMAVKTMHARTYDHVMLVHGFLREAQVTGQLDHPNIVPIHELGRDERGELFFTMKLVDGESLKARIGGVPPRSHEQLKGLLEVFIKVCDALAFAHNRGVIHCDIKSANVMVGRYGQVYLMDWGGAQLLKPRPGVDTSQWVHDSLPALPEHETQGMVFGTPAYMSPEQASAGRDPVDERSDVFSMGALLHEMMTGRPPYFGGTAMEMIMRAQIVDIVAPDEQPHLYSRELIRIVMTAMARRPQDRYQTVEELQAAISGLLSGGGSFPTIRVQAGELVIREGEVGDAAYWIESGSLEVFQIRDGQRKSLRVLHKNAFFGETAIFARTTRTASVVATTDAVLKVFTASALEGQLDSMTPWMRALIQTLAKWFAGSEEERRGGPPAQVQVSASASAVVGQGVTASTRVFAPTAAADDESIGLTIDVVGDEHTDVEDLADGQVEDPEDEANTRLIGPWKRKPPPRPKQG
jgi:serine/threonine protein kinase